MWLWTQTRTATCQRVRKHHLSNLKNEISNLSPSSKTWWRLVKSVSGVCASLPSLPMEPHEGWPVGIWLWRPTLKCRLPKRDHGWEWDRRVWLTELLREGCWEGRWEDLQYLQFRREWLCGISHDWKTYSKCLTSLWFGQGLRRGERLLPVCQKDKRCHSREWSHQWRDNISVKIYLI